VIRFSRCSPASRLRRAAALQAATNPSVESTRFQIWLFAAVRHAAPIIEDRQCHAGGSPRRRRREAAFAAKGGAWRRAFCIFGLACGLRLLACFREHSGSGVEGALETLLAGGSRPYVTVPFEHPNSKASRTDGYPKVCARAVVSSTGRLESCLDWRWANIASIVPSYCARVVMSDFRVSRDLETFIPRRRNLDADTLQRRPSRGCIS
jgi:hypothetical protein